MKAALQKNYETLLTGWSRAVGSVAAGARRDAELTQQDVADAFGVHRNTVVKMEAGTKPMPLPQFLLLARLTKHPPAVLFDRVVRY